MSLERASAPKGTSYTSFGHGFPSSLHQPLLSPLFRQLTTMTATIEQVSGQTFDVIICGGGTSGLTCATRLARAHRNISVLVIEAGEANLDDKKVE